MLIGYTMLEDPLSIEIHIHLSMYMLRSTLVYIYMSSQVKDMHMS